VGEASPGITGTEINGECLSSEAQSTMRLYSAPWVWGKSPAACKWPL